jgi:asparagine synthase (glutamine-hydrolysing)
VATLPASDRNMSLEFKLKKFVGGSDYESAERQLVWLGPFAPHEKSAFFTPEFSSRVRGHDIFAPAREALGTSRAGLSDIETAMLLDLRFYLGENLMTKVDRASMMHSLEVRTPFLDYRVVEFASQLPVNLKLRGWKTKYILKKAVAPVVPASVISRKKKGFGIPLTPWIRKELKDNVMEALSPGRLRADGIFDPVAVGGLLDRHLSGGADERKKLWNLFIFQQWKERWG